MRKQVLCPLCGRRVENVYHTTAGIGDYSLSLGECSGCRLAFRIAPPSKQESYDYMDWRWSSTDPKDSYVTDVESKKKTCRDRMRWLRSFYPANNKLLDIGAGNGAFCHTAMDFGYEVTGTETSAQAVKLAKELFGVQLIHGDIDSVPRSSQFGVVTMWDVIEHLRDPLTMLNEIRARMVGGGIVVIETGNYEYVTRLWMKERWGLYLFDHMFYFSPRSLEALVSSGGFSDFQLYRSSSSTFRILAMVIGSLEYPKAILQFLLAATQARQRWPKHWNLPLLLATAKKR